MKRLERLTALLSFLQSKSNTQLSEIAQKFDVGERTIFRDLNALQAAGVPIGFEKGKGYFIVGGHFLSPLSFTLEEAKSMLFAEQLAKKYFDAETGRYFSNALEKIKNKLNAQQLQDIEALESKTRVYIDPAFTPKYLQMAEKACSQNVALKLQYQDAKGHLTERFIEPIGITFYSQGWHMIAFCRLREDYRDFALARIQSLQMTSKKFSQDHWTLAEYIQNLA